MPESKKIKVNTRTIADAEDFGLFFNCLTRRYLWELDHRHAELILRIMDGYLLYFSTRTLICSIRDLAEGNESIWRDHDHDAPDYEDERYARILMGLVQRYLDIELNGNADKYWKRHVIQKLATDGYFTGSYRSSKDWRFPSVEAFEQWVKDHHLDEGDRMPVYDGQTLPYRSGFREDFLQLCIAVVQYSYGRTSYMPGVCRDFIRDHFVLITDEGLKQIDGEIGKDLQERPLVSDNGSRGEMKAWEDYRETIRMELISREWNTKAWDLFRSDGGLIGAVGQIADTTKLSTEAEFSEANARLEGIDRYLAGSKFHGKDKRKYRKCIADAKAAIAEKAEEIWFVENRGSYEKVGPHLYRRRDDVRGRPNGDI